MSRSFVRLLVIAVAGLFGGFAGLGLVAALDTAIGLQADNGGALLLLFLAAFIAGIYVAVGLARRLIVTWIEAPFAGFSAADRTNEPPLASLHPASAEASTAPGYIPFEGSGVLPRFVRAAPSPSLPPGLVLVGSLILFLVTSDNGGTMEHVAILAGVLLFHEAALALGAGSSPTTTAGYAARMLIYINIFNLLPVTPLDGGRLLELLIFDRHRVLQLTWRIVSAAAFALLGLHLRAPLLAVIAGFQLLGLPGTWAVATAASALRRGPHPIPLRLEDASDALINDVHALHLDPKWGHQGVAARASWIRLVVERAVSAGRGPGLLASLGLAAAWGLCMVVAFVAIVISARTS